MNSHNAKNKTSHFPQSKKLKIPTIIQYFYSNKRTEKFTTGTVHAQNTKRKSISQLHNGTIEQFHHRFVYTSIFKNRTTNFHNSPTHFLSVFPVDLHLSHNRRLQRGTGQFDVEITSEPSGG